MRRDDDASELDAFAVLPKLFESVSPPTVFRENVHDDVERVDDAPAAVRLVLHAHVRRGNDVAHRLFQLDAQRALGITLSNDLLMSPTKSVTAVIGLFEEPRRDARASCSACPCHDFCLLRASGRTCGR